MEPHWWVSWCRLHSLVRVFAYFLSHLHSLFPSTLACHHHAEPQTPKQKTHYPSLSLRITTHHPQTTHHTTTTQVPAAGGIRLWPRHTEQDDPQAGAQEKWPGRDAVRAETARQGELPLSLPLSLSWNGTCWTEVYFIFWKRRSIRAKLLTYL